MLIVALLLVLLVLGLNVAATVVIVRRDGLSAGGRAVQLLLVWLLPLVGAILCLAVATADGSGSRGMAVSHDTSVGYSGEPQPSQLQQLRRSSDGGGGRRQLRRLRSVAEPCSTALRSTAATPDRKAVEHGSTRRA